MTKQETSENIDRSANAARNVTADGAVLLSPPERLENYYDRGLWTGRTVDSVFREAVAERGDKLAVTDPLNRKDLLGTEPLRLTFDELNARVNGLCEWFAAKGLQRGDRVVMQMPNIVEGVCVFLACARSGLILSPVAAQYRSHELGQILPLIQPKAFLTVAHFGHYDYAAGAKKACQTHVPDAIVACWGDGGDGIAPLDDVKPAENDAKPLGNTPIDANEVLTICWTSGTESASKGVPRHHNHWVFNGEVMLEAASVEAGEAFLNPFPMINIASLGGMVMPWLLSKGVLVQHHPFDLSVFLRQIEDENIVYTVVPPAVLNQLLKAPQVLESADISSLRRVGSGSSPLSPWMVEGWQSQYGITILNIFGSNEGASLITTGKTAPDPHLRATVFPRFGTQSDIWPSRLGRCVRTRLVDPDTEKEVTAPGEKGELRIDGAMTFDGYWTQNGLNKACFDAEGYFRTGDLFEIVDDKFYRFVGRTKEIIIRGGVNISPAEIESIIEGHPKVREAACASYPDERLGERVCAVVALHEGQELTLEEVNDFLKEKDLAVYKLPEKLKIVDALPRNALGKVLRRELNEVPADA